MTSRTSVLRLAAVHHPEQLEEERCRRMPWKKREGSSRRCVSCLPFGSREYFELVRGKAGPCGGAGWRDAGPWRAGRICSGHGEREREGEVGRREAVRGGRR